MTSVDDAARARYTQPGRMTAAGRFAGQLGDLPADVRRLTSVGHGLLIHEHIAGAYGVTLAPDNQATVHVRPIERILEQVVARDDRPLDVPRDADQRTGANCRHYTVFLVSALRTQGTPARARCGFGNYFGNGLWEDHWVAEYWNAPQQRWILVDGQIDDRQLELFDVDFDLTDVPRDRFRVAGDAWRLCRSGVDSPDRYGLSVINESGLWWIAGNLMRDAAALLNIELLPWDVWGAMPAPFEEIDEDNARLFDQLAELTATPDVDVAALERLCHDDRLRVPAAVRNALRQCDEPV
ncbi:MAG: hypothetical protein QOG49_1222 [Frankiaceae bacterium]|jgi:hypothetical protein|nr:hypothetical protein [Frankiaceae bacterium]